MRDTTFDDRLFFARMRSKLLAPGDVLEAVYRGHDPAFAALVGRPAVWVVVGDGDGIAELAPRDGNPEGGWIRSAPLTDFRAVTKIATLADSPR